MTFIIALGIIIVLLCSASIFKLLQPREDDANRYKKKREAVKVVVKAPVKIIPEINLVVNYEKPVLAPIHLERTTPAVKLPAVISLQLMADKDRPYCGYELLQGLLSQGMRFGKMGFFHRHVKKTGVGDILFSLAACTKEGTFDLSKIGGFSSKGLILYMRPGDVEDPVAVFEMMLKTADQLITDLGGKVLSDKQELLTKDEVLGIHQILTRYIQDKKSLDLFTEL